MSGRRSKAAVTVTHLPTGEAATVNTQRSQHKNRDFAVSILKGKLAARSMEISKGAFGYELHTDDRHEEDSLLESRRDISELM